MLYLFDLSIFTQVPQSAGWFYWGRETEGREMDGGGNAGGNKRNVRELLAAAKTHLFMHRQLRWLLLLLQLTCATEQHQLTIGSSRL